MRRRYVLISPCRDEAEFLQKTIDSVVNQTVLPAKWLIVDDGSTDDTPRILAEAAARYPFIEVVRREDRGERSVGPGVIDAFYFGLDRIDLDAFDYVCKFDTDLEFGPRYFERLMERCEDDRWLGTVSGKLYLRRNGRLIPERCGDENSVGPTKFYRVDCFQDIGGFVREVCWDGIDGHLCRMKGWCAASFDDADLQIVHLRQMGSSHKSLWTGRKRWGRGKYFMGSAWYYALAAAVYRMGERPWVLSGLGIMCGYLSACWRRPSRYENAEYRTFLRRYELLSLVAGKRKTMTRYHDQIRRTVPMRETPRPLRKAA